MKAYEKLELLGDDDFKIITGVTKEIFHEMLCILKKARRGSDPKGSDIGAKLTRVLEHWDEHHRIRHMANEHQIPQPTMCRAMLWMEDILSDSPEFEPDLQFSI